MTQSNATTSAVTTRNATVADLHRDWVFGWDRNDGDGVFSFRETFGSYYDGSSDETFLYDDFDPEHRVARSPVDYGAIWEPPFNSLRSARHYIADGPHVVQEGALAASRLVFLARLETLGGTVTNIRTTTSLVWHLTDEGWRIVREHNSTVILSSEAFDEAVTAAQR